jgi:cystathionine beta-lyase
MPLTNGIDRRAFLRNAGMTALVGTVGSGGTRAGAAAAATATAGAPDGPYDFDEIYPRFGTECIKWDRPIERFGKGSIAVGMGIADLDFKAAPCITRALAERCRHENWGYLAQPASYVEAIVNWNTRRYGVEVDPGTVVLTTGVHPGLIAALHTFAPPGSKVLLTTPTYNGFYSDLEFCNVLPEDSPMTIVDGRYTIDFDDFERRARRTNVFILCNPQNPTGNCWSPEDLTRMGEICLKHRVVVLADEIHCDFVRKGERYTPFASLPDRDIVDNSLTFKAASKTFSLAAMKAAWFFSTNPDYLARVKANNRAELSTLGMVANRAALTEGEPWLDQLLPYIDRNHAYVETYVKEKLPQITYTRAQGTYLAWLDVAWIVERIGAKKRAAEESRTSTAPVTPEMVVERWLVEHAKVHLNPGSSYGTGGGNHMRMNIGTSRKLVTLALDNIARAVGQL